MNFQFIRTDSSDENFVELVKLLDGELAVYNGERNDFFAQYNAIPDLNNVIVLFLDAIAVACGAFKPYDDHTVEIKRMYVRDEYRRQGLAVEVLQELEKWAKELNYTYAVLETGSFLPGTVALYTKCGYDQIPNYGQYAGIEGSICFRKKL